MAAVYIRKALCLVIAGTFVVAALAQQAGSSLIHLAGGTISINGEKQPGSFSVTRTDFKFLYFYLPGHGLVIVSNRRFANSVKAGSFEGRRLRFELPDLDFKLVATAPILEKEGEAAWVRWDRTFSLDLDSIMFGYGDEESTPYDWPTQIRNAARR